jgi:TonB family protein
MRRSLEIVGSGFLALSLLSGGVAHAESDVPSPGASVSPALDEGAIVAPSARQTPLDYPAWGEGEHTLVLELLVLPDGSVKEARLIAGDAKFGEVAVKAAQSWTFSPATKDGEPVPAWIRFEVQFEPPQEIDPSREEEERASESQAQLEQQSIEETSPTGEVEVVVQGERQEPEGARSLSRASVRQLPGAFGDAFRAVESLPGVTPIVSGLPYFYVRGAPPGNVGYFLDGIRVPLLYHIAAGPSVIHPAFIDRVDLYAGPYPARYGRFVGGIIAGETAPPAYDTRGELSHRLVDAGGMIETHAFDHRLSIMAAGR